MFDRVDGMNFNLLVATCFVTFCVNGAREWISRAMKGYLELFGDYYLHVFHLVAVIFLLEWPAAYHCSYCNIIPRPSE